MKKILLATTVLVGTAGFASAEVTLSGNGRMGITYAETAAVGDKETSFNSRVRASVNMSASTDGGLEFGGSFGIHDAGAAAGGTEGSVFISGAFGKLTMGGTDSAAQNAVGQLAGVGYTGLGDHNEVAQLADVDHVRPIGTQVLRIMSWTVSVSQSRICSTVTATSYPFEDPS